MLGDMLAFFDQYLKDGKPASEPRIASTDMNHDTH
jgi:hypothetical protein